MMMKRVTGYMLLIVTLFLGSVLLVADFPVIFAPPGSEREIVLRSNYNDVSTDMTVDNQGNVINMLVSVEVDSLDDIVIAGVEGFGGEGTKGLVLKLDPDGVVKWEADFAGLSYDWRGWPQVKYFFGLEIDPITDNIYVVGSLKEGGHRTLIAGLDSSGSELWRTEWEGPPDSNGTDVATFWLSSQEDLVVRCNIYGGDDPLYPYTGSCMASFAKNGTLMWNRTVWEFIWNGIETGPDEFATVTDSWRGYNEVTRYAYDLQELSSFDLVVGQYYSISLDGFGLNGTNNIIGYGEVVSLVAGASVTRGYSALFQGPQPPQTLVLSCTASGELEWYDFLILGRMSEPCGVQFDPDNRLIIAGHTSEWSFYENDFYVVFGFRQTPFLLPHQILLVGFFPLLNILMVALISEIEVLHIEGRSVFGVPTPSWKPRNAVKGLLLAQAILFLFLYTTLVSFGGGGGPPAPIVYLPQWVSMLILSLPIGILTLGILFLKVRWRERTGARSIAHNVGDVRCASA
jgi:hypothetical protein